MAAATPSTLKLLYVHTPDNEIASGDAFSYTHKGQPFCAWPLTSNSKFQLSRSSISFDNAQALFIFTTVPQPSISTQEELSTIFEVSTTESDEEEEESKLEIPTQFSEIVNHAKSMNIPIYICTTKDKFHTFLDEIITAAAKRAAYRPSVTTAVGLVTPTRSPSKPGGSRDASSPLTQSAQTFYGTPRHPHGRLRPPAPELGSRRDCLSFLRALASSVSSSIGWSSTATTPPGYEMPPTSANTPR